MSRPVLYARLAEDDLGAIGEWIGDAAGLRIAIAYVRRLRAKCETLRDFPGRGTPRDEYGPDIRSLTHDDYLILYRTGDDATTILRVLHSRRSLRDLWLE